MQGLEQGDAVFEEHTEGAGHMPDDQRAVDARNAGQAQQQAVGIPLASFGPAHPPNADHDAEDEEQDDPPAGSDAVADGQQDLRGHGKRAAHVRENLRDLGDHERQQEDDDADAHEQHEDGVGQRSLHLAHQSHLLFDVLGEAFNHEFQRAGGLARPHHGYECRRENIGEFRQPVGEIPTRHDPVAQTGNDALHPGGVVVCADARKGLVERKARVQQCGKLAGHGGDSRFGDGVERFKDFFEGALGRRHSRIGNGCRRGFDGERHKPLFAYGRDGLPFGVSLHQAAHGFTLRGNGLVAEIRHETLSGKGAPTRGGGPFSADVIVRCDGAARG